MLVVNWVSVDVLQNYNTLNLLNSIAICWWILVFDGICWCLLEYLCVWECWRKLCVGLCLCLMAIVFFLLTVDVFWVCWFSFRVLEWMRVFSRECWYFKGECWWLIGIMVWRNFSLEYVTIWWMLPSWWMLRFGRRGGVWWGKLMFDAQFC